MERPPIQKDSRLEIKEMELRVLDKFLSNPHQKTQITADERILISVLRGVATNPYPVSQEIAKRLGIPFDPNDFKLDILETFIDNYIEMGIPINREGRREEKEVMKSYFESLREEKHEEDNNIKTKLMK